MKTINFPYKKLCSSRYELESKKYSDSLSVGDLILIQYNNDSIDIDRKHYIGEYINGWDNTIWQKTKINQDIYYSLIIRL